MAVSVEYNEWVGDTINATNDDLIRPTFTLPDAIRSITAFKFLEIAIPFTYYTVSSTNNTFTLVGNTTSTITIPVGNYTSSTFPAVLKTALDLPGDGVFAVTISLTTGKMTISSTVAFYLGFNINNADLTATGAYDPRIIMGFNNGYSSTTLTKAASITAPNVVRFSGPDYVYVNSARLGILNRTTLHQNNLADSGSIAAKIPVTVNPGGLITWVDPDPLHYYYAHSATIDHIDLWLTLGTSPVPLDLNGASFQVKIGFLTSTISLAVPSAGSTGRIMQ